MIVDFIIRKTKKLVILVTVIYAAGMIIFSEQVAAYDYGLNSLNQSLAPR